MAGQTVANENAAADVESVEALLADLDLGDEETTLEAVEELIEDEDEAIEEIVEDEVTDDDLRDLELREEREQVYQEQESEADANPAAVKEAQTDEKKRAAGKKRAQGSSGKSASTPRAPRDLSSIAAEFFVLEGDVSAMSDADKEAAKTATMALKPTQKKIAEKFENLFQALSVGKLPSVYVVQAFKLLDQKEVVTSSDIVASFKMTYKQGTAMSQTGQIMNLFHAVKIATRSGQTLTLNKDSVVAQRLRDAINAAAGA